MVAEEKDRETELQTRYKDLLQEAEELENVLNSR